MSKTSTILVATSLGVIGLCGFTTLAVAINGSGNHSAPGAGEVTVPTGQAQTSQNIEAVPTTTGPSTKIKGNGIFRVGIDIQPGQYRTVVPKTSIGCYWARLNSTDGTLDAIIANMNVEPEGVAMVTIVKTDKAFQTERCGTWEKVG